MTAKRDARRRHWHCAAIWRLWSRNDITWRLNRFYTRRRRRTLVVSSRDCPWSAWLLPQARVLKGHLSQRSVSHHDLRQVSYDTCRASGLIHVGHRGFRSVMSHDDVHQWSPAPIGLAAFSTRRSNWVSGPRSGQIVPDALPAGNQSFPGA